MNFTYKLRGFAQIKFPSVLMSFLTDKVIYCFIVL